MLSEPIHKAFVACSSVSSLLSPCKAARRLQWVKCSRDEEMGSGACPAQGCTASREATVDLHYSQMSPL